MSHKENSLSVIDTSSRDKTRYRKALADAIAGVAASLISLWIFYPLEVLKINAQASTVTDAKKREHNNVIVPPYQQPTHRQRLLEYVVQFYKGLGVKSLQTATSNFTYFYLYSWILSLHYHYNHTTRHQRSIHHHNDEQHQHQNEPPDFLPATIRLLLSALAAILNTFITLPLDVLSTQQQQQQQQLVPKRTSHTTNGRTLPENATYCVGELATIIPNSLIMSSCCTTMELDTTTSTITTSTSHERAGASVQDEDQVENNFRNKDATTPMKHVNQQVDEFCKSDIIWRKVRSLRSLWKGLNPSLMLCLNPAINYTIFDVIKSYLLNGRLPSQQRHHQLTLSESFLVGMFAKLVSTLLTYPLIRMKVKLMACRDKHDQTLWSCLRQECRVNGLYHGCQLQLLHTLLKSAVLMMLREHIEGVTRWWLVPKRISRIPSS